MSNLTPWTREQSLAIVTAQIERNRAADATRLDARNAQIIAAVEAGSAYAAVAESLDLTVATIVHVITRHAPHLVGTGRNRDVARRVSKYTERNEQIFAAVASGVTYREVAMQFGMTVSAVESVLAKYAPHLRVRARREAA